MRLISLCPSVTKLVFDLGLGADLVGITRYCIHPSDEVARIEKVGGTKNPDLARIAQLTPDLILMNREENRRQDWELLQQQGLQCHVSAPDTIDATIAMVLDLGKTLQVAQAAAGIAEAICKARTQVRTVCKGLPVKKWAYLIWRKPWMTVNGSTYIHHVLAETGAANVFAQLPIPYPEITAQQLADADPDLVMLSSEPFRFKEKHAAELARETGLPLARFVLVDGESLSWHGCFTRQGLLYAAELITG